MHAFQPYPIKEIEFNPFVRFGDNWGALTTKADDKVNSMTISWGGVGMLWNKPAATVYVRESRFTKELLDKSETFSVSFLPMTSIEGHLSIWGRYREETRTRSKIQGLLSMITRVSRS